MQKFATIEDFREDLDIEICATLERDFNIEEIEISFPDGTEASKAFVEEITHAEWEGIFDAIREVEVYTGH